MACKLISIDLSSTTTGYAVWHNGKLVKHGILEEPLKIIKDGKKVTTQMAERFDNMFKRLSDIVTTESPDIIVIEDCIAMGSNMMFAKHENEIIGCLRGWAYFNDAYFYKYLPQSWRKLVAPAGTKAPTKTAETKIWSKQLCHDIFNINVDDNESDAILIGLAYIKEWSGK